MGYTRIQGALANFRHEVGRGTIAKILREAGIDPAPGHRKGMTWNEFLATHWEVRAPTDFLTAEVWTPAGLVRYHVLFAMRLPTLEVRIARTLSDTDGHWMNQMARNLAAADGFLSGYLFLIQDRSSLFTEQFRETLKSAGVESMRLPAWSPNLNSYAERFVLTLKESCLDDMILLGESSLREAVSQFVEHYHQERNHEGLDNQIIRPEFAELPAEGLVNGVKGSAASLTTTTEKTRENRLVRICGHSAVPREFDSAMERLLGYERAQPSQASISSWLSPSPAETITGIRSSLKTDNISRMRPIPSALGVLDCGPSVAV